jgi:hypothetical protein
MKTETYLLSFLTQLFLEWEIFQTKVVEKIKMHFVFSNLYLQSCLLWDNVEKSRTQITTWRTSIASSIPKARNATSEYVTYIAIPLQQWLHENPHCYVISTFPLWILFM